MHSPFHHQSMHEVCDQLEQLPFHHELQTVPLSHDSQGHCSCFAPQKLCDVEIRDGVVFSPKPVKTKIGRYKFVF